jgi:hypothetical protein
MHSLVITLLEECLDPSVVTLQTPHAVQMSKHAGNHARNPGNAFEKQEPDHPLRFGEWLYRMYGRCGVVLVDLLLTLHPSAEVHAPSAESHEFPGAQFTERLGWSVIWDNIQHFLLGITMVRPCRQGLADVFCLLDWEKVSKSFLGSGREGPRTAMLLDGYAGKPQSGMVISESRG